MWVCPDCGDRADTPGSCPRDGGPRVDAHDDPLLGATIGSYRITRLIGAGAMGRVYRAAQPSIGGRVAMKFLAAESDATSVERFFAEARAVNTIRHERIVNVLDLGSYEGRPFIVMEHLEGAPLSKLLKGGEHLPLGGVLLVAREVLDAVGAAHAHGMVHRDLKPDNVFVTRNGHAKVLDFGIAKLAADDPAAGLTMTGALMGTPKYMSPEQALAMPCDARADLYALGVILYEACTGAPPFVGNAYDILAQHIDGVPPPAQSRRADLPVTLEASILRALAKRPDDRFASAREMNAALEAVAHALPDAEQVRLRVDVESSSASARINFSPTRAAAVATPSPPPPPAPSPSPVPTPPSTRSFSRRRATFLVVVSLLGGVAVGAAGARVFSREPSRGSLNRATVVSAATSSAVHAAASLPSGAIEVTTPQRVQFFPYPSLPPNEVPNPKDFDVAGFADRAAKYMQGILDRPTLYSITASTDDRGVVNLVEAKGGGVQYLFDEADDAPVNATRSDEAGVGEPPPCGGIVYVDAQGITVAAQPSHPCVHPQIMRPSCSTRSIVSRAALRGLPPTPPLHLQLESDEMAGQSWEVANARTVRVTIDNRCN